MPLCFCIEMCRLFFVCVYEFHESESFAYATAIKITSRQCCGFSHTSIRKVDTLCLRVFLIFFSSSLLVCSFFPIDQTHSLSLSYLANSVVTPKHSTITATAREYIRIEMRRIRKHQDNINKKQNKKHESKCSHTL